MNQATSPRVSILIPNYNNGIDSSQQGNQNLIKELLDSLEQTLSSDPTPFEVIAYDDGSTDDSLQTLRDYANRAWPNGTPFLELIESTHTGILAISANILSQRAKGDILVRLDGDVVCLTPNWVSLLCQVFDQGPARLGVVGPKQLNSDMKIHAFGDWVLHPNGYCHVALGLDRYAIRYPMEVDHVMGSFYCCKKKVYEDVGGYDERILRGQTVDFGLQARLKGWSCIAVPHIEYVHHHGMRVIRDTPADSQRGVDQSLKVFSDKWGFNRIAPDLELIHQRYAGTPLLWNARWFAAFGHAPPEPPVDQPLSLEKSQWGRYTNDTQVRQQIDMRVSVAMEVVRQIDKPRLTAQIGSGAGLIVHLLAQNGLRCVGIDRQIANIDLARVCTKKGTYKNGQPRFEHQTDPRVLPLEDESVDLLLVFDQMEQHPNPVALLREASRVVAPDQYMAIVSKRKQPREEAPTDHEHRYRWRELVGQVLAVRGWKLMIDPKTDDPKRDMILVVKKLSPQDTD